MTIRVNVGLKAADAKDATLRGDLIVVIDVLRCTSTIITALSNGAEAVIPVRTIKEAREIKEMNPDYLLAGERRGFKPLEFDLGNSPLEFTPRKVYGKTIILTTTSGTKALKKSEKARYVLVGAFLNASSIAKTAIKIARENEIGLTLLASGEKGKFSLEDFLCVGAIAKGITKIGEVNLSDTAQAAILAFQTTQNNILSNVQKSRHAKYLIKAGLERDVEFCCKLDLYRTVPFFRDGRITP
ncbi:TPA: 2-phosphosulfolactate phosphatase [Candidatus Bathyarchaeota archaeon]|nr:2-phosphosulfolactate phosphatase [Candidatus Bathyarchaeota archaeon]